MNAYLEGLVTDFQIWQSVENHNPLIVRSSKSVNQRKVISWEKLRSGNQWKVSFDHILRIWQSVERK